MYSSMCIALIGKGVFNCSLLIWIFVTLYLLKPGYKYLCLNGITSRFELFVIRNSLQNKFVQFIPYVASLNYCSLPFCYTVYFSSLHTCISKPQS